jgi:hypothetical protein
MMRCFIALAVAGEFTPMFNCPSVIRVAMDHHYFEWSLFLLNSFNG